MSDSVSPETDFDARRFRRNTWIVAFVVTDLAVLVAIGVSLVSTDWVDHDLKNIVFRSSLVACAIFLANWFFWRSSVPRVWKWRVGFGLVLFLGAFSLLFRIDDVTGDMNFRIVRRGGLKHDQTLELPQQMVDAQPDSETANQPEKSPTGENEAAPASPTIEKRIHVDLTQTTPHDFPQFMGAKRNGKVEGVRLADDWQAQPPKLLWRQPVGAGWSGFAVVGPYAITQEQRGEQELVVCYQLQTGAVYWLHSDAVRFSSVLGGDGPRATPTIDEGFVYAQGATGILNCLDGATGQLVWSRDIITENGAVNIAWGRSGSPLVVDDKVIVSAGGPEGKSLVAYHKRTGEPIWSAGSDQASYASPVSATIAGVPQVLTVNQDFAVGHDLADGRELWRIAWPGNSNSNANTSQPVALPENRVFLSKGYGHGCAVYELKPAATGFEPTLLWHETSLLKTKMTNVVIHDEHVYGLSGGILECVELVSGERMWKGGRYGHGQVLLVGDRLLISAENGEVALVAASPEKYRQLSRIPAIEGITWNTAALVGPHLLIRNNQEAACYELPLANP